MIALLFTYENHEFLQRLYMIWERWPYILVMLLAAGAMFALAAYAWRRRSAPAATTFAVLSLVIGCAGLAGAIESAIPATSLDAKVAAKTIYAVCLAPAPALLFMFAAQYTHRERWLTKGLLAFIWGVVILEIVLVATNRITGVYWPSIGLTTPAPDAMLDVVHGPINVAISLLSYALVLISIGMFLATAAQTRDVYRIQNLLAAFAVIIPITANVLYVYDIGPLKHFDFTPVAFAAAGVLLAFATFRYHLVDLAPMAHDVLFANLGDAVVAVNERGIISAANPKAIELLSAHASVLVGTRVADLSEPWSSVLNILVQRPTSTTQETTVVDQGAKRVFEASRSLMVDRNNKQVGTLTIIHDITAHKMLQAALASMNVDLEDRVAERTAELSAAVRRLKEEVAERERAESSLRQMQDSLADHVTSLSKKLGVLYDVILVGDRRLPVPEVRSTGFDLIMAALEADAGFMLAWEVGSSPLPLLVQRDLAVDDIARISQLSDEWLFGERLPRVVLDLDVARSIPAALKIAGAHTFLGVPVFRHDERVGFVGIFWRKPAALGVDDIALFTALSDQLAILVENARLRQQREAEVALEERRRLARDLHDSATQSLNSVLLMAEVASNRLQQGQYARLETPLAQISHSARQALREMRLLLFELRARSVPQGQLVAALEQRLDSVERRAGVEAVIVATGAEQLRAPETEEIYWIALEALNNALKHSSADRIEVSLSVTQTAIVLQIDDNGCGFDDTTRDAGGIGLQSMAERAARLSGDVTVTSAPGNGTRVFLQVPAHPQQGDQLPAAKLARPDFSIEAEAT